MRFAAVAIASFLLLGSVPLCRAQQDMPHPATVRATLDRDHNTPEWANIAAHLPDLRTADPATLERAADVLRARRYPHEALAYYQAAINHGGEAAVLLKKMGVACLEMQEVGLAHAMFQQATHAARRDPDAWNNLGASEFLLHNPGAAVRDYRRAVRFGKESATYHSNLALAYFDVHRTGRARKELARALELDPDLLHRTTTNGYVAQVLASENYADICFEMARLYAAQGNREATLDWLTKAGERGYNLRAALEHDPALRPLLADAEVQVLLKNTGLLEARSKPPVKVASLGPAQK